MGASLISLDHFSSTFCLETKGGAKNSRRFLMRKHFIIRASRGQKSPFRTFPLSTTFRGAASKTAMRRFCWTPYAVPIAIGRVFKRPFERTLNRRDGDKLVFPNVMMLESESSDWGKFPAPYFSLVYRSLHLRNCKRKIQRLQYLQRSAASRSTQFLIEVSDHLKGK